MQKIHSYLSAPPPPIILTLERQHPLKELLSTGYVQQRHRVGIWRLKGKLILSWTLISSMEILNHPKGLVSRNLAFPRSSQILADEAVKAK
jgi:hypothetical protein